MKHWKSITIFNKIYYSWEYILFPFQTKLQVRIWATSEQDLKDSLLPYKGIAGEYMLIPKAFFERFISRNSESLFRQWPDII